jgi:hypothetical protein
VLELAQRAKMEARKGNPLGLRTPPQETTN